MKLGHSVPAVAALSCATVLSFAAVMFAQPPAADPSQRFENMLTKSLDLNATQQNQVHTILADARVQSQGFSTQLRTLRSSLTDAIKANNTAQIDTLTMQISQLQQQTEAIHSKAAAAIYAVLNPDQQAKVGNAIGMLMGGRFGPGEFSPGGREHGMRHRGGPPKQ